MSRFNKCIFPILLILAGFIFTSISTSAITAAGHPVAEEKSILSEINRNFLKQDYKTAWQIYEKNYQRYPYSVNFDYLGGRLLLFLPADSTARRNRNYTRAVKLLANAIKYLDRNPRDKRRYRLSLFYTGMAHYKLGNVRMAISYMQKVIEQDDRFAEAWYNMAVFYEKTGNTVEANRAYYKYREVLESEDIDF